MDLWAASLLRFGGEPPFANVKHMHELIDSTPLGDAPWTTMEASYTGELPANPPSWMTAKYELCFRDPRVCARNMLANPDFAKEFDTTPYREYDGRMVRQYCNLLSGDWAWEQADLIAEDPDTHGAMVVPLVLGSDKTTVSVGTGDNEYYPLYISLGNVYNNVRRAHCNAVLVVAFLAIPKAEKKDRSDPKFRKFRRQIFHTSVAAILQSLKVAMSKPEVAQCPDGHFRRVIYSLGPYIADYMEQVLVGNIVQGWCVTCPTPATDLEQPYDDVNMRSRAYTEAVVADMDLKTLWQDYGIVGDLIPFTNDFPRADIHELMAGDILHQLIKGCFKDHLVDWINDYLVLEHGETKGHDIMDQIDRRIRAAPSFPGLRNFKEGRDFKQWTGDDSKGLMKVYLPAVVHFLPSDMVRALSTFTDFCYLVRRSVHTDETIQEIQDCLDRYHTYREIFRTTGVREEGFSSLPRQHSAWHYPGHIRRHGAPNGLCSSITESKHIKAVKEPWRRSNHYEALSQMLLTNQRVDKLAAARTDFKARRMLEGTCLTETLKALLKEMQKNEERELENGETEGGMMAERASESDSDEEDDDDDAVGILEGPRLLGDVVLARRPGALILFVL
ncbi:hypothetical protein EW026_g5759 [Hermanssonia centrifuga]|uniref:Uncharacterized protein n=1 Tax=Hermanssonia centrifuga TaxID=98765 RepID=A0A4S4KEU2_9APHY|nr:hypothetical protein EW026_g5759 [Hermanssonia centrifuga]